MQSINFPKVDGINFYLAGGAVRDTLMDKQPKDKDFVMETNFNFNEVISLLESKGVRIFQSKPEFQIILTQINGERVDLAFPRTEGKYIDGRRPEHTERTKSLMDDASRRDFTMNAMFVDEHAKIIDFFGGIRDIKAKTIRAVGNPDERFEEDALRILRALRFSVVLGFGIEVETYKSMRRNLHLLKQDSIATDRIKDELNKAFKFNPYNTMILMRGLGLMEVLNEKDPKLKIEITNRS